MPRREEDQERNRSLLGKLRLTYRNQKNCSLIRKHPLPNYTANELIDWAFSQGYEKLHQAWVESDYERFLSPSCDRKDNTKPYSLNNLVLMTWRENLDNQKRMNKDGSCVPRTAKAVNQLTMEGEFITRYESAAIALRAMTGSNKSISNITQVCNGKWKSAYGFRWEFADQTVC